jgi:hypothetical protein
MLQLKKNIKIALLENAQKHLFNLCFCSNKIGENPGILD